MPGMVEQCGKGPFSSVCVQIRTGEENSIVAEAPTTEGGANLKCLFVKARSMTRKQGNMTALCAGTGLQSN